MCYDGISSEAAERSLCRLSSSASLLSLLSLCSPLSLPLSLCPPIPPVSSSAIAIAGFPFISFVALRLLGTRNCQETCGSPGASSSFIPTPPTAAESDSLLAASEDQSPLLLPQAYITYPSQATLRGGRRRGLIYQPQLRVDECVSAA